MLEGYLVHKALRMTRKYRKNCNKMFFLVELRTLSHLSGFSELIVVSKAAGTLVIAFAAVKNLDHDGIRLIDILA